MVDAQGKIITAALAPFLLVGCEALVGDPCYSDSVADTYLGQKVFYNLPANDIFRAQFVNVIEYQDGACSGDLQVFFKKDVYGNENDINIEGRGNLLASAGDKVGDDPMLIGLMALSGLPISDTPLTYKTSVTQDGGLYHQWWPGRR